MTASPAPLDAAAGSAPLLLERDGAIATVVLNRPAKLNAFTLSMWQQLGDTFRALSADVSVRCVIVADIRICGESSRFGAPIKNLGLVMAHAEMAPLIRLVGEARTLELLFEGRIIGAAEAHGMGLVSRVVPDAQVAAEARATAERIASGAPLVARWHKKFARQIAAGKPLCAAEIDEAFDCFDTDDFRQGFQSFLAKETPRFSGR
ncbi:enoyl-CoA hydratase [Cupriavidus basilensis OR16]|uniref:Enoyl-CoA hydratase n=1 Tax=Cupriavidus basilensis OR16 TaxID=1127483 RepID=H1S6T4_9BURK|nr:enoyl-CoA hydratase-related protein [Cupriavidus basilensis]EHP41745.1 enoyl-CoA hydratase [Cupriavidus basilensis OR16]